MVTIENICGLLLLIREAESFYLNHKMKLIY